VEGALRLAARAGALPAWLTLELQVAGIQAEPGPARGALLALAASWGRRAPGDA
jgi:hypothetical protein